MLICSPGVVGPNDQFAEDGRQDDDRDEDQVFQVACRPVDDPRNREPPVKELLAEPRKQLLKRAEGTNRAAERATKDQRNDEGRRQHDEAACRYLVHQTTARNEGKQRLQSPERTQGIDSRGAKPDRKLVKDTERGSDDEHCQQDYQAQRSRAPPRCGELTNQVHVPSLLVNTPLTESGASEMRSPLSGTEYSFSHI